LAQSKKCYKCGLAAYTREHIPPLCLFPEIKDSGGNNYRINLLTVPSCELHNTKKSKDDEFLLMSLAGIVGNNFLAYFHNKTKVKRAFQRKNKNFIDKIIKDRKEKIVYNSEGNSFPVYVGSPDLERLVTCFENIAYGVYNYEFNKVFTGECKVLIGFLQYKIDVLEKYKLLVKNGFENKSQSTTSKGSNKVVFKYQFCKPETPGLITVKMTFYGGSDVYVTFKESETDIPFDLTVALIEAGFKTYVEFENGEFIEFNSET